MNIENECEQEKCLQCELVDEFKLLVNKEDIPWEDALRYVLYVSSQEEGITEQELGEAISDAFSEGFEEGLQLGVTKAAKLVNDLVEYTDEQIVEYHAQREAERNGELTSEDENTEGVKESEEIEDISDEDFDKIGRLIKGI